MTLLEKQQADFLNYWTIDKVGLSRDIESEASLYDAFYSVLTRWVADSPTLNLKKPAASMVESFAHYLDKNDSYPQQKFVALLNTFNYGLSHHVDAQKRVVYRAPPSEPHPIKKSASASTTRAHALLEHHQVTRLSGAALRSESAIGELWIALILRCLCLEDRLVKALASQLHEPLYHCEPWCWLNVDVEDSNKNGLKTRRVFFDPISAALWSRLDLELITSWQSQLQALPAGKTYKTIIFSSIKAYLKDTGFASELTCRSYNQLILDAKTLWGLRVSPLLIDYACGTHFSTSMPDATWRRIMGFEPLQVASEKPPTPAPSRALPPDSSQDGLQPLRKALKLKDRARCKIELVKLRSDLPANHHTWLVSDWLIALFDRLIHGNAHYGKPSAPSGLATTLGAIGTRLELVFKGARPASLAPEDRWARYEEALESTASCNVRPRLLRGIRDFDNLIAELNAEEPINWKYHLDNPDADFLTSANLISFDMLKQLAEYLSTPSSPFIDPETRELARLAVILGGKTGMRRGEIWGLQVSDIHQDSILVQKNAFRRLKTGNATRRASLLMLTQPERNVLMALKDLKSTAPLPESGQAELITSMPQHTSRDYLFRQSPASTSDTHPETDGAHFFASISKAMTKLSGDSSLHFHHLRHTLASWLAMFLLSDDLGLGRFKSEPVFTNTNTYLKPLIDRIKASCRDGSEWYTLANLLGHSSPKTTLHYYIHTLDICLHLAVTQQLEADIGKAYASLAGLSRLRDGARIHRKKPADKITLIPTINLEAQEKLKRERIRLSNKLGKGRTIPIARLKDDSDVKNYLSISEAAKRLLGIWLAPDQIGNSPEQGTESKRIMALAAKDLLPPDKGSAYTVAYAFLVNVLRIKESINSKNYVWMLENIVDSYNRHKNYNMLRHDDARKVNAWLKKYTGAECALIRLDIKGKFARGTAPYRLSVQGNGSSQRASRPLYWVIFALHQEVMNP